MIVLLILAVITTVGLSIASRSVTEISTSTTNDESSRALAAAEAGVEAKLANVVAPSFGTSGETSVTTTSSYGVGSEVALNEPLAAGEVGTIFLATHDSTGKLVSPYYGGNQINICWGQNTNSSQSNTPAIEIILYYFEGGVYKVSRLAYDPNNSRRASNSFSSVDNNTTCSSNKTFSFSQQIKLNGGGGNGLQMSGGSPLLLRIRLFYNGDNKHYVGIVANNNGTFPGQGQVINSTGQAGVTSRKVQVFQQYPDPMAIFDSAVFSKNSLLK